MAFQHDDISINTLIGVGARVSGDLSISGFTRIDGDIDGNLEILGKIIVGEKARIRGNITAQTAIICGIVEGNITAPERVQVFETATVIGAILTHRLEVAEQVVIHGHCISLHDETEYDKAVDQWKDVTTIRARTSVHKGNI